MLRILIEGDSYGLPRFAGSSDEVALFYEETYPEKLRRALMQKVQTEVLLISRCLHANTTNSLVRGEASQLLFGKPDVTVIALGLTDLWPAKHRHIVPLQTELTQKDPWVNADEYESNITKFTECAVAHGSRVALVSIPQVARWVILKYPEVAARIEEYNLRLQKIAEKFSGVLYVDWHGEAQKLGMDRAVGEDGIHPTPAASQRLADILCDAIRNWRKDD